MFAQCKFSQIQTALFPNPAADMFTMFNESCVMSQDMPNKQFWFFILLASTIAATAFCIKPPKNPASSCLPFMMCSGLPFQPVEK